MGTILCGQMWSLYSVWFDNKHHTFVRSRFRFSPRIKRLMISHLFLGFPQLENVTVYESTSNYHFKHSSGSPVRYFIAPLFLLQATLSCENISWNNHTLLQCFELGCLWFWAIMAFSPVKLFDCSHTTSYLLSFCVIASYITLLSIFTEFINLSSLFSFSVSMQNLPIIHNSWCYPSFSVDFASSSTFGVFSVSQKSSSAINKRKPK